MALRNFRPDRHGAGDGTWGFPSQVIQLFQLHKSISIVILLLAEALAGVAPRPVRAALARRPASAGAPRRPGRTRRAVRLDAGFAPGRLGCGFDLAARRFRRFCSASFRGRILPFWPTCRTSGSAAAVALHKYGAYALIAFSPALWGGPAPCGEGRRSAGAHESSAGLGRRKMKRALLALALLAAPSAARAADWKILPGGALTFAAAGREKFAGRLTVRRESFARPAKARRGEDRRDGGCRQRRHRGQAARHGAAGHGSFCVVAASPGALEWAAR